MMRKQQRIGRNGGVVISPGRLKEEIDILQKRLKQIGPDGDCGYEKAMIRFYHQEISLRRDRLAGNV